MNKCKNVETGLQRGKIFFVRYVIKRKYQEGKVSFPITGVGPVCFGRAHNSIPIMEKGRQFRRMRKESAAI